MHTTPRALTATGCVNERAKTDPSRWRQESPQRATGNACMAVRRFKGGGHTPWPFQAPL